MSLLKDVLTSHDASVIPLDARQADYSRVRFYLVQYNPYAKGSVYFHRVHLSRLISSLILTCVITL